MSRAMAVIRSRFLASRPFAGSSSQGRAFAGMVAVPRPGDAWDAAMVSGVINLGGPSGGSTLVAFGVRPACGVLTELPSRWTTMSPSAASKNSSATEATAERFRFR